MSDYAPTDMEKAHKLLLEAIWEPIYRIDNNVAKNVAAMDIAAALAAERKACQSSVADLVSAAERVDKAIASIHAIPSISNEDAGLSINATWIDLRNALVAIRARGK